MKIERESNEIQSKLNAFNSSIVLRSWIFSDHTLDNERAAYCRVEIRKQARSFRCSEQLGQAKKTNGRRNGVQEETEQIRLVINQSEL